MRAARAGAGFAVIVAWALSWAAPVAQVEGLADREAVEREFRVRELALQGGQAAGTDLPLQLQADGAATLELALDVAARALACGRDLQVDERTLPGLRALRFHAHPNVRTAALRLLALWPDVEAARHSEPDCRRLLEDPWPPVRELAVAALVREPEVWANGLLVEQTGDRDPAFARAAGVALIERFAAGRLGSAAEELEDALLFETEPSAAGAALAAERHAAQLEALLDAGPERLSALTRLVWAGDARLASALHALSLAAGGEGDIVRVVEGHFASYLPLDRRAAVARAAARRANQLAAPPPPGGDAGGDGDSTDDGPGVRARQRLRGTELFLQAGSRAARIERSLRERGTPPGELSVFDAGLAAELARQPEDWSGTPARELFEIAIDSAAVSDVARRGLELIEGEFAAQLFLGCLDGETLRFDADLVDGFRGRYPAGPALLELVGVFERAGQEGDAEAFAALLGLLDARAPEVAERAFRALAKCARTPEQAAELRARGWAPLDAGRRAERLRWLGGGVPLEPFALDLIALGQQDAELRPRVASLLARVTAGPDHGSVLLALERWLVEAQFALAEASAGESGDVPAAERRAAAALGQLAAAGGEAVLPALQRSLIASNGRSLELGRAAAQALGRTPAGRRVLLGRLFEGPWLELEPRREALLAVLAPAVPESEWRARDTGLVRHCAALLPGADPKQRTKLAAALGRLATEPAFATLAALAADPRDELLALSATAALAADPEGAATLSERFERGPSYERRLAAARALGASRDPRGRSALAELFAQIQSAPEAFGLRHPDERPPLEAELLELLAKVDALPAGAVEAALARFSAAASDDLARAFADRPGARPQLRWRTELAVLAAAARTGEFGPALEDAPIARLDVELLAELADLAARGGDARAAVRLGEARLVAALGLDRPLSVRKAAADLVGALGASGAPEVAARVAAAAAVLESLAPD